MDIKQNHTINQETLSQLKPACKAYRKAVAVAAARGLVVMAGCFLLSFFMGDIISGVIGNTLAVILIIAAIPLFFGSTFGLNKNQNFIYLQEQANKLNTTTNDIFKIYKRTYVPVPITFLINGIILIIGDIGLFIILAWRKATMGYWLGYHGSTVNGIHTIEYDPMGFIPLRLMLYFTPPLVLGILYLLSYIRQRKRPLTVFRILAVITLFLLSNIAFDVIYIGIIMGVFFH